MLSTYYRVAIAQISGTANSAGFIDPTKVEQYMANANTPTTPATLTASTNKVMANTRYKMVIEQLQLMGNVYLSNAVGNGGDANTPPTSVTFTLESERGDETLQTLDETANGVTLYGANAITRCVARALCETRVNYEYPVFDPTPTTAPNGPGASNAIARAGSRTLNFTVGALSNSVTSAASSVTVTYLAP